MATLLSALKPFFRHTIRLITFTLFTLIILFHGLLQMLQLAFFSTAPTQYRTVAITMASSGMGKALAYEYAKDHQRLVLFCDDTRALEAIGIRCLVLGSPSVETITLNLRNTKAVNDFFAEQVNQLQIDLFIANVFLRPFDVPQMNGPSPIDEDTDYVTGIVPILSLFRLAQNLGRRFQIAVCLNTDGLAKILPYSVDLLVQFDVARSAMRMLTTHLRVLGKQYDVQVNNIVAEEYLLVSFFHMLGWSAIAERAVGCLAAQTRRALSQNLAVIYPPVGIFFITVLLASLPATIRQELALVLQSLTP